MRVKAFNIDYDATPQVQTVVRALQVIVLDPAIARYLQHNDPQALQQAQTALRNYFNAVEEDGLT